MNDVTSEPKKISKLAVAALTMGLVGPGLLVVVALLGRSVHYAWEDALLYSGGLAVLLGFAAVIELIARRRTHRGWPYAIVGALLGFANLFG